MPEVPRPTKLQKPALQIAQRVLEELDGSWLRCRAWQGSGPEQRRAGGVALELSAASAGASQADNGNGTSDQHCYARGSAAGGHS